jgi:hypothetical protein
MRTFFKYYNPLSYYATRIKANDNFKFLRFGDGQFICAMGIKKYCAYCELGLEHSVYPELTKDIKYILSNLNPLHINALQGLSTTIPEIAAIIPDYPWHYSDVFHEASEHGELYHFFEALDSRNVVVIGRQQTRAIKTIIKYSDFIEVKEVNCYFDKGYVLKKLTEYPPNTLFLFASSMLSVPTIYFSERTDCTMIDIGSLLDPYIGFKSRAYHKNMAEETILKNIGVIK